MATLSPVTHPAVRGWAWAARVSLLACVWSLLLLGTHEAGAVGGQWGPEFAIDAPWRIEPSSTDPQKNPVYGPIPIAVMFYDAIFDTHRDFLAELGLDNLGVGKLVEIQVREMIPGSAPSFTAPPVVFKPTDIREIDAKFFISTKDEEPPHERCRPHLGESCDRLLNIAETHEWHALLWYTPRHPVTPGRNIQLDVRVITATAHGRRDWRNYLVVHAGEAPLPRFDANWLYGDFHYHSQMTDNEGESGYSYRNVVRALGALGMDFVFATDHASGGEQVDGWVKGVHCERTLESCYTVNGQFGCPAGDQCVSFEAREARDLNDARFRAAKQHIYGPGGANEIVAQDVETGGIVGHRSRGVLPQVFMGEEADTRPHVTKAEQESGWISFGAGLRYGWANVDGCVGSDGLDECRKRYSVAHPDNGKDLIVPSWDCRNLESCIGRVASGGTLYLDSSFVIRPSRLGIGPASPIEIHKPLTLAGADSARADRFLLLDLQGAPIENGISAAVGSVAGHALTWAAEQLSMLGHTPVKDLERQPSRQHLVYFPYSTDTSTGTSTDASNEPGFVPSHTGRFGGGSRILRDILADIEANGKAFLAHPLASTGHAGHSKESRSTASRDNPGPDIVPYSRTQLEQAWASEAILGLQLWNEDVRRIAYPTQPDTGPMKTWDDGPVDFFAYRLPWWSLESWQHYPGGIGEWNWPGGGDSWIFSEASRDLWRDLYHGAYTWDEYLRKGLDRRETDRIPWLSSQEPRKWFMAGGSDSHGDWNFRRHGSPGFDGVSLSQWSDSPTSDSAIGKPRNLVLVEPPRSRPWRPSNRQVIDAVAAGRFGVTDGPIVRVAVDRNRNGRIDATDFQMGSTFHVYGDERVPLLVEWISSPEFGGVEQVDVYIGTQEQTFAPREHGVPYFGRLDGEYAVDPSSWLRVSPQAKDGSAPFHGMARLYVSPTQFGVSADGQRFYIRAFAKAVGSNGCAATSRKLGHCGDRLGYSNPIWGEKRQHCTEDQLAIDTDGDRWADVCDACPQVAGTTSGPSCGSVKKDPCIEGVVGGSSCQELCTGDSGTSCLLMKPVYVPLVREVPEVGEPARADAVALHGTAESS